MLFLVLAHAHPNNPCEALLNAKPIARTSQQVYPIEIEAAGQIILPGQPIPILKTGFYVYLITAAGEILLSEKYKIEDEVKNLATHKSLLEMYRREFGANEDPAIVAADDRRAA